MSEIARIKTGLLGREVTVREGTSDRQVWADTFSGLYHKPPSDMPEPATVLDLGANIGLTAAHYAVMWPSALVVAVEMDEACCDLIEKNAPTVRLRRHAVSSTGGWGSYNPDLQAEAYSFRPRDGKGRVVRSFTLQHIILREFGDDGVDFCKMDVEGEEWALFKHGTWAPLVRHLVVELHGDGGSEALLHRAIVALELLGFEASHHERHPQSVYARSPDGA